MKIKPILFSGPNVRAVIEGRKTQTRRRVKPQPWKENAIEIVESAVIEYSMRNGVWNEKRRMAPEYVPGDILWVRETWAGVNSAPEVISFASPMCRPHLVPDPKYSSTDMVIYRADGDAEWTDGDGFMTDRSFWRPSIHMPKWACRIWLRVTNVRVELIQDISIEDSIAEGIGWQETPCPVRKDKTHSDDWYDGKRCEACGASSVKDVFRDLWNSLYAARGLGWDKNPWVWVIQFERCEAPDGWPDAREVAACE